MMFLAYDSVASLGTTCQTAWQLRRLGVRQVAGPLDWFITPFESLCHLLRNRFRHFMARENLQVIGTYQEENLIVRDMKYNVDSYHDFPAGRTIEASFDEFKAKMDRRIGRFLADVGTRERMLFVISSANVGMDGYGELADILASIRGGRDFTILANGCRIPVPTNPDPRIYLHKFRKMKRPGSDPHWRRGCDEEWDQCLRAFVAWQRTVVRSNECDNEHANARSGVQP